LAIRLEWYQLDNELKEKSWLTVKLPVISISSPARRNMERPLKELGGDYEMMVNFPIDPQLN